MALGDEMGGQVVSASINASAKTMETLLKILDRIFQLYKERTNVQYKAAKDAYKKQKLYDKVNGLTGFVAHDKLRKAGVPLTVANVHCNEEQFQRICELCKKQGVLVSGVTDPSLDGTKTYTLEFKKEDAARIAAIVDFVNIEEKANRIQDRISEVMQKSPDGTLEGLSQEDQLLVKALNDEIHSLQIQHTHEVNHEIVGKGVDQEFDDTTKKQEFDEVMNRLTENVIKQPMTYYVLDSRDPEKYIECQSAPDTFHDRPYTKTQYKVYSHGELVLDADDGRFEGRERDFWTNLKAQMKEKGGFNDEVIRFNTKEEMETYISHFKAEQQREVEPITDVMKKESRTKEDYEKIKKQLVDKIHENGFDFDEKTMTVFHKDGRPLVKEECCGELSPTKVEDKVLHCEAYWNADLFKKFMQLQELENQRSVAEGNLYLETEGTVSHAEIQASIASLEAQIDDTKAEISHGTTVLGKINAMQCDDIANRAIVREFTVEFMDELQQFKKENAVELEPLENNDPQLSMEEWQKLIEERKKEREREDRREQDREVGRLEYTNEDGEIVRAVEFATAAAMLADIQNHPDMSVNAILYTDNNEPFASTKDIANISKAASDTRFEVKAPMSKDIER